MSTYLTNTTLVKSRISHGFFEKCRLIAGWWVLILPCFASDMVGKTLVIDIPISMKVDQEIVRNKWTVSVPIQKIQQDWTIFEKQASNADDKFISRLLRFIHDGMEGHLSDFFDLENGQVSITNERKAVGNLKEMTFPEGGSLSIVGKVPEKSGEAYIECRSGPEGIDFPILNLRPNSRGELRVETMNNTLLDVAIDSLMVRSTDEFWSSGHMADPLGPFDQNGLLGALQKESDQQEILEGIHHCLNEIKSSGGKEGFTPGSRKLMSPETAMATDKSPNFFADYARDAQQIEYLLNFDPVCVTIQRPGANRHLYYYLKTNGGFLNANAGGQDEYDGLFRSLPEPSQEELDKVQCLLNKVLQD